jgi:thiol-disulfide isomerase/thioredoxin
MRRLSHFSILLFLGAGCADQAPTPTTTPVPVAAPEMAPPTGQSEPVLEPVVTSAVEATNDLKLEIMDWDQTLAIVAASKGKVVVLDLWATFCPPCVKELPGLVALQARYPDQVVCVSVCVDHEGDADNPLAKIEPDVRELLVKLKAHQVRNVLLSTVYEDLFKNLEHGSPPVLYVYDQSGKRVAMFPDLDEPVEPTYAKDVVPVVEKLLANPPQP